jgi:hypothetical protein
MVKKARCLRKSPTQVQSRHPLALPEAEAPQPTADIHVGDLTPDCALNHRRRERGLQVSRMSIELASIVRPPAALVRTAVNCALLDLQVTLVGDRCRHRTAESHREKHSMSMPAFGSTYTDTEIAAGANYVTGRFGSAASKLTAKDVADLRGQTTC